MTGNEAVISLARLIERHPEGLHDESLAGYPEESAALAECGAANFSLVYNSEWSDFVTVILLLPDRGGIKRYDRVISRESVSTKTWRFLHAG